MTDQDLLQWAAQQPDWTRDALRRISTTRGFTLSDADRGAVLARIKHATGGEGPPPVCEAITAEHLSVCGQDGPRAVMTSIGPVENIDRLAKSQQLRFAPVGVTLIFGENGSGKSGYARIAKRLCRSLSVDELRGDVFAAPPSGPIQVKLRYQLGSEPVTELDWAPDARPPAELKQISVFDSRNARLYVDQQNRIAYLPVEIAILEHHGQLCGSMGAEFKAQQDGLEKRLRTPLPAGYTPGGVIAKFLDRLDVKSQAVPSQDEIEKLASLSKAELEELTALERKLLQDPVAQAQARRRASLVLTRLVEVLQIIEDALSEGAAERLRGLGTEARAAADVAILAAAEQFADEPLSGVGNDTWRRLYLAARDFAVLAGGAPEKIPDQVGDACPLCQEPLGLEASTRLGRFNTFVQSESSKRADAARDALAAEVETLKAVVIPPVEVVSNSLVGYASLGADRAQTISRIEAALTAHEARRQSLIEQATDPAVTLSPLPASERAGVSADIEKLGIEAAHLEASAAHATALDAERARIAELKDRRKLRDDLATVLGRAGELRELAAIKACQAQVQTRGISLQMSALRRRLVTENLQRRIEAEIGRLDLKHLPFRVSDSSEQGQSRFAVGLQGVDKIPKQQILSEGEQRALALACFLAEVGADGDAFGLVIDDPVSSLDQRRIRLVAERLVQEAVKGRQVIVFTHSLVFFNEVVSEAARVGSAAPLIKMVVRKTEADGFGVVEEDTEPWLARSVVDRLADLRTRAKGLGDAPDLSSDTYRRQVKDFYSDLRESWERCVEEVVLNKTVQRLVPDVMTQRLEGVIVTDEDYRDIYFAMKRVSERSGHDMPAAREIPVPTYSEMIADVATLERFQADYRKRRKPAEIARRALLEPTKAALH